MIKFCLAIGLLLLTVSTQAATSTVNPFAFRRYVMKTSNVFVTSQGPTVREFSSSGRMVIFSDESKTLSLLMMDHVPEGYLGHVVEMRIETRQMEQGLKSFQVTQKIQNFVKNGLSFERQTSVASYTVTPQPSGDLLYTNLNHAQVSTIESQDYTLHEKTFADGRQVQTVKMSDIQMKLIDGSVLQSAETQLIQKPSYPADFQKTLNPQIRRALRSFTEKHFAALLLHQQLNDCLLKQTAGQCTSLRHQYEEADQGRDEAFMKSIMIENL